MTQRLDTGIDPLDKKLQGGIPPGAIVTCVSDSRTQAELLLHRILAEHDTIYLSTIGNEETVQAELAKSPVNTGDVEVLYASPDSPLQQIKTGINDKPNHQLTILNSVNVLEDKENTPRGSYQEFLNWLQNMGRRTGGVVLFHRYKTDTGGDHEHLTNSMSDIILELEEHIDGDTVVNYLHMPKCRGAGALDERLKVTLTDGLSIDTSRDIA